MPEAKKSTAKQAGAATTVPKVSSGTTTKASDSTSKTAAAPAGSTKQTDAKQAEKQAAQSNGANKPRAATLNVKKLPVRPGEDPWTKAELEEVRAELEADIVRQEKQIAETESELAGLLRDGSDGAGRDPADVGSSNFERDQEMSLAQNARSTLDQSRAALRHIELGTFGVCENCGEAIGKGRLQAFPRATLCVRCKQREERR